MISIFAMATVCLVAPVQGTVTAGFEPSGQYGGHWGIDYSMDRGAPVHAPAAGVVTFAGSVAGMKTVTIQPMIGVKVSLSFLDEIDVRVGARVGLGQRIGRAGIERGRSGVHMSLRINGRYVDPERHLSCRSPDVSRALRLITPPQPYPRRRAHRHSRRDLRSDPHRSSPCGRGGAAPSEVGPSAVHAGRGAMAEIGPSGVRGGTSSRHDPPGDRRVSRLRSRRS